MKLAIRAAERYSMSDVAIARAIMHEIWPARAGRPVKICLNEIYEALRRVERSLAPDVFRERRRQWTPRRVKAIWKNEAKLIENFEMEDLEHAALEAAGSEYTASIERSKRMADIIFALEEARYRTVDERHRAAAWGLGRA